MWERELDLIGASRGTEKEEELEVVMGDRVAIPNS